jgi:hypothetical protein
MTTTRSPIPGQRAGEIKDINPMVVPAVPRAAFRELLGAFS